MKNEIVVPMIVNVFLSQELAATFEREEALNAHCARLMGDALDNHTALNAQVLDWDGNTLAWAGEEKAYNVAIYDCDRAFGGPEEGGWWYDCGTLVTTYTLRKEAAARLSHITRMLDDPTLIDLPEWYEDSETSAATSAYREKCVTRLRAERDAWEKVLPMLDALDAAFPHKADALALRDALDELVDQTFNLGKPPVSSVASQGRYQVQVVKGSPAPSFPSVRPHYE